MKKSTSKPNPKGITLQAFLIKLGYEDFAYQHADNISVLKFCAVLAIGTKGSEKMMDKALEAVGVRTDEGQKRFLKFQ